MSSGCARELSLFISIVSLEIHSVSYPFEFDLGEDNKARQGSNITLSIDLVGGKVFKIIGLMLCSY